MTRFLAVLVLLVLPVSAAEITTIAGAAVQAPLLEMAKLFQERTGHVVKVQFDTVPSIVRRLEAGDATAASDILVATSAAMDQAAREGRVNAVTRVGLGRIGIGVAVSKGATKPNVATVDALKAAILAADAVVTSQGTSGTYVMKMLADIGVFEQVKAKTVQVASGVAVMERLGTSRNEIGFTMMSEVMHGAELGGGDVVGPLPRGIQNFTGYDAAVMTAATSPEEARQFVRTLVSPAARRLFVANGWQVPDVMAQ